MMQDQMLVEKLQAATSQDPRVLQEAETQLHSWSDETGFYPSLCKLVFDANLAVEVRLLAAMMLKNGADKKWRKTAGNVVNDSDKKFVREILMTHISNLENEKICVQIVAVVGKISRFDVPREWPELVPYLMNGVLQDSDSLVQLRSLQFMKGMVKVLAAKRLGPDRQLFRDMAGQLVGPMAEFMWKHGEAYSQLAVSIADSISHGIPVADQQIHAAVMAGNRALLAAKTTRVFLVHGFKDLSYENGTLTFMKYLLDLLKLLIMKVGNPATRKELIAKYESFVAVGDRLMVSMAKLVVQVQDHHHTAIVPLLPAFLDCFGDCIIHYGHGAIEIDEKVIIHSCIFLKHVLKCSSYKAKDTDGFKIVDSFFTSDRIQKITEVLISKYVIMKPQDLEQWQNEPEDFIQEEGGDNWKFLLRPCAENFYTALLFEHQKPTGECVVGLLQQASEIPINSQDMNSILLKDAIYNAVGLGSYDLYEKLDFDGWLQSKLLIELNPSSGSHPVIRRRVCELMGYWVGVKMNSESRQNAYGTLAALMEVEQDKVVALTAAFTVKELVDDLGFEKAAFLPHVESILTSIAKMIERADEADTKTRLITCIGTITERLERQIGGAAETIVRLMAGCWQLAIDEDHNMLKAAILSTFGHLVRAVREQSVHLHQFLLPIINYALDVNEEAHIYLAEDALELWLDVLKTTDEPTEDLLNMFPRLPPYMLQASEGLKTCIKILESYLMLSGTHFLHLYSQTLLELLQTLLRDLRADGVHEVLKVVDLVLQLFPQEGPTYLAPILDHVLSRFMELDPSTSDYPPIIPSYMSIFHRYTVVNFNGMLMYFNNKGGMMQGSPFLAFLDKWMEMNDTIGMINRRKLSGLALANVSTIKDDVIASRLPRILDLVIGIALEMAPDEAGVEDMLMMTEEELADEEGSPEYLRRRSLQKNDAVFRLSMKQVVREKIKELQHVYSVEAFNQLVSGCAENTKSHLMTIAK
eukprot:Clim_evm10s253 gene=Clim_evmTU10s253